MVAYAGLDVGTSGTKMVVYDLKGNVLYMPRSDIKNMAETVTGRLMGTKSWTMCSGC